MAVRLVDKIDLSDEHARNKEEDVITFRDDAEDDEADFCKKSEVLFQPRNAEQEQEEDH